MSSSDPRPPEEPDEDAAWASIVANFGERIPLTDEKTPTEPVEDPAEPTGPSTFFVAFESDDHYLPPEPPPVGLADGARGAAWLGVIGAPSLFLITLLFGIELPSLISLLAVLAFLTGLGYLFTTMRHHHDDDPWDDGARV